MKENQGGMKSGIMYKACWDLERNCKLDLRISLVNIYRGKQISHVLLCLLECFMVLRPEGSLLCSIIFCIPKTIPESIEEGNTFIPAFK